MAHDNDAVLLLLPPLPEPPSYAALKAAYHDPLLTLLRSLSQSQSGLTPSGRPVLDIALLCPHLWSSPANPRSTQFAQTQKAVAALYKLICIISAKNGLEVDGVEAVDTRVLLVRYPRDSILRADTDTSSNLEVEMIGPVVSIHALASSGRWNVVYAVESEQGEAALRNFTRFVKADVEVKKLRAGIVHVLNEDEPDHKEQRQVSDHKVARRHFSVANGGTYDHLHVGHKLLLTMTAFLLDQPHPDAASVEQSGPLGHSGDQRKITIGLTAADLLKNKKYAEYLESWQDRYLAVHAFLRAILCFWPKGREIEKIQEINDPGPNGHAVHIALPGSLLIRYVEIWDPFGPTITDPEITALVVSGETRKGGQAVNEKRTVMGWEALEVFEVDVLDAVEEQEGESTETRKDPEEVKEAFEAKLSSTEIRKRRSEGVSQSKGKM